MKSTLALMLTHSKLYEYIYKGYTKNKIGIEHFCSRQAVQQFIAHHFPVEHKHWHALARYVPFLEKKLKFNACQKDNKRTSVSSLSFAELIPSYFDMCVQLYVDLAKIRCGVIVGKKMAVQIIEQKLKNVENNAKRKAKPYPVFFTMLDFVVIATSKAQYLSLRFDRAKGYELNNLTDQIGKSIKNTAYYSSVDNRKEAQIRKSTESDDAFLNDYYMKLSIEINDNIEIKRQLLQGDEKLCFFEQLMVVAVSCREKIRNRTHFESQDYNVFDNDPMDEYYIQLLFQSHTFPNHNDAYVEQYGTSVHSSLCAENYDKEILNKG
jgi:hypothetical protein